jgi:hypothetical protein
VARRRLIHPVDLLALVLAVGLAVIAYAYVFHRTPVPRPVDPLLGAELVVEFEADRDWKRTFPLPHRVVLIAEYLDAELLEDPAPAPDRDGWRRLRLRILGRDRQRPEGLTMFRTGIRRGAAIRIISPDSELTAEVVSVREPGDGT